MWLMRQAGRILPQYRALRESVSGFKELVTRPELAAEATLQPLEELGVDATILFSDILVVPEAMGLTYEMEESKGPYFPKTIEIQRDIDQLAAGEAAAERLDYVYRAVRLTKNALYGRAPLIGFAGAPWTLFAYMVEGKGSKTFAKAKRMLFSNPAAAHRLLEKITDTIIVYLNCKIQAGVNAVQVFDSWAGLLSPHLFAEFSLPYLERICKEVTGAPVILFPKDGWFSLEDLGKLNCTAIGLDWTVSPTFARQKAGVDKVLQGNLDPCVLYADERKIETMTQEMLKEFGGKHIANLGHGVYPDTPLDGVRRFVETVKDFKYEG